MRNFKRLDKVSEIILSITIVERMCETVGFITPGRRGKKHNTTQRE